MTRIRQPAVASHFYPDDPRELARQVDDLLERAEARSDAPKALIVPHAGYIYSGPVAATAYAALKGSASRIRRVLLLGPAHRVALRGLATSSADAFATPLGSIPLDRAAIDLALQLPQVREMDEAHRMEHSLEVQLPFLQRLLSDFTLAPFVVGDADAETVSAVLELLWGGPETLVVISSDLSHYLDYDRARAIDATTSAAIEALAPGDIGREQACGRNPINGLLNAARKHGLKAETLDLRNSGDTAGPRNQVVGYGAYVFH